MNRSLLASLLAFLLGVSGCADTNARKPTANKSQPPDATALTVMGELALEHGDCRTAAESYAQAAQDGRVELARRATEVGVLCDHIPAAWQAAKRWRVLEPEDKNAATVYGTIALKQYKISEARASLSPLVKEMATGQQAELGALLELLTDEVDATSVMAALEDTANGFLEDKAVSALVLATFGQLSLQAYDLKRAEQMANAALVRDPKSAPALRLLSRVRVLQGDAAGAIATARDVMQTDAEGGAFELAEVFAALDRIEEARQELERLRSSDDTNSAEIDRRLALLAFQGGDFDEAQRRFVTLVNNGEASDAALFYLGDIAAMNGDNDAALSAYRQLADSSLAVAARTRAAAVLLDKSDRAGALALLDDYVVEHPERSFDLTLAKAHLLAEHGDPDGGLALLTAALARYPKHPGLQYERAVLLDRAGRVKESVRTLEEMMNDRPGDPSLQNALGYTLADHKLDLARAENHIRDALKRMPDNPAVLDSLAWVRFRRGDAKGSLPTFERAYRLGKDPEIAAHWGEALWSLGEQQEARRVWAAALAKHPDSEEVKAVLNRLAPAPKP